MIGKSRNAVASGENMLNVPRGLGLRNTAQTSAVGTISQEEAAGWTEQTPPPPPKKKTVVEQLVDGIREGVSEWRPTEEKRIVGIIVEGGVMGNEQLVYQLCELVSMRGPTKTMAGAACPESYTYYLVGEISWLGNIVIQVAATFFMPLAAQNWFIAQFHSWCSAVLDLLEECEVELQQVEQDLLEIRQSIGSQIDLVIHALGSALVRGPKSTCASEAFDDYLGGLRNSVRIFIESYHIAISGQ